MKNLNEILEKSKSISDLSRFIFGKENYTNREKCKKILLENGIDWKKWSEEKKIKPIKRCLYCGEIINSKDKRQKFCNQSCAASYNNLKRSGSVNGYEPYSKKNKKDTTRHCLTCGKIIGNRSSFCSNTCHNEYQYREYINKWKEGKENGMSGPNGISDRIRRYLFEKNNSKCEKCGWSEVNEHTNRVPLQIHHIDGDCTNNKEENLQLLCPNCHSLTETFGSINNRKSSRVDRRTKYFREEIESDLKVDITEVSRCIVCGKKLEPGQTTFCSQNCVKRYYVKNISKEDILKLFEECDGISFARAAKTLNISTTCLERKCRMLGIKDEIHKLRFKK